MISSYFFEHASHTHSITVQLILICYFSPYTHSFFSFSPTHPLFVLTHRHLTRTLKPKSTNHSTIKSHIHGFVASKSLNAAASQHKRLHDSTTPLMVETRRTLSHGVKLVDHRKRGSDGTRRMLKKKMSMKILDEWCPERQRVARSCSRQNTKFAPIHCFSVGHIGRSVEAGSCGGAAHERRWQSLCE